MGIIHSANAWWMDRTKMDALIYAFRIGGTIPEACATAGITLRQYKYFTSLHPWFHEAREMYKCYLTILARKTIAQAIEQGDVKASFRYLEKHDESWGRPKRKKNKGLLRWEQRQKEVLAEPQIPGKNAPYPEDEMLRLEMKKKLLKNIERRNRASL